MNKATWGPLFKFESRDFLVRYYDRLHSKALNANKAHQIGASFTQAREYFASAQAAASVVKPLLLYYGVASLCRAAVLLKDASKTESSLKPAHGLMTNEWTKTLSKGNSAILELGVQSSKGLFREFVEAIGNRQSYSWLNADKQLGHFSNDFGTPAFISDGSEITLGDLLSREHDLLAEFEMASDGWGNVDVGNVVAQDSSLKLYFILARKYQGKVEEMLAQYRFPDGANFSVQPHPKYRDLTQLKALCVEIPGEVNALKASAPLACRQEKDIGYIVRPLPNGDNLIDIHRMVIEAYILGMFSRYYPARWISLLNGEKGDIARTVLIKAVDRIEAKFPGLARDQLS